MSGTMNWDYERYKRQLGLVHQHHVHDLNVLVLGQGPALSYIAINLALVGVGTLTLPANSNRLTAQHLAGQFLFHAQDYGSPISETLTQRLKTLNPHVQVELVDDHFSRRFDAILCTSDAVLTLPTNAPIIWAGVTDYGMYIGAQKPIAAPLTQNFLTPALASLCGALTVQEMLRVTHCVRVSEIQKFWVTLNYAFNDHANAPSQFTIDGRPTAAFSAKLDDDVSVYQIPVNLNNDLARLFFEQAKLDEPRIEIYSEPIECLYYSPFWSNRLEHNCISETLVALPELNAQRIVLGGIGGLGTWVAALLAVSNVHGELVIFDSDTQVENHNLNRQVLYDDAAIGLPKVHAAARALEQINPALTITSVLEEIQATTTVTHAQVMEQAHLAISAFDNFQARYVFSEWAAWNHVALVNGGSDGFNGDVQVIDPDQNGCLYCHWEHERGLDAAQTMKDDQAHRSCTRQDANAPEVGTALVTTSAAIASWQTLLALLTLAKTNARVDHQIGYLGKESAIEKCRLGTPCPVHEKGACDHPRQFWQMLTETIHGDNQ
jgi:molybdopterin/thiamine biosynthesis adenylyltransferase